MNKIIFTKEQIEQLLKNENVTKCSETSISYSKPFKIKAVKLYNEQGLSPSEIFKQAGFDLNVIGKKKPKGRMECWNKIYRAKGLDELSVENRGKHIKKKKPKIKILTDADKIKWLEAENAYLKAENDFLAKLRARRRK
jgi:transposase-like protein